jgi:hypothetical protein
MSVWTKNQSPAAPSLVRAEKHPPAAMQAVFRGGDWESPAVRRPDDDRAVNWRAGFSGGISGFARYGVT